MGETAGAVVTPLRGKTPGSYTAAIEPYLSVAGIGASSRRIYRISLATWAWLLTGA